MNEPSTQRVFLSYSWNDKNKVDIIRNQLLQNNIEIFSDATVDLGQNWVEEIKYRMESSDFVLALLSPSLFESNGVKFGYTEEFIDSARNRSINLIPVIIESAQVPPYFMEFEIFDLTQNIEHGLKKLISRIKSIKEISFENFTGKKFEDMVYDLLRKVNFQNIKREEHTFGSNIDFIAEYYSTDPFGNKQKEIWIVESKFYKEARFDIKAIQNMLKGYKYIGNNDVKLLLITNSHFTSVVQEFLGKIKDAYVIDVRTIDGLQLKNIIAREPEILNKYFFA
jgi:hypothetical protein